MANKTMKKSPNDAVTTRGDYTFVWTFNIHDRIIEVEAYNRAGESVMKHKYGAIAGHKFLANVTLWSERAHMQAFAANERLEAKEADDGR